MGKKISIKCKKDYFYEDRLVLSKDIVYDVDEYTYNNFIRPLHAYDQFFNPNQFYEYFYTKQEMRDMQLDEIGI